MDGLPIDHMQGATSTGPLAWITSGKLDGVIDVSFPRHPDDEVNFNSVLSEIIDNVSELASRDAKASRESINPGQRPLAKAPLTAPAAPKDEKTGRDVVVDVDLRFRDLKAVVPYMPDELSYVNAALIRPIVAFIKWVLASAPLPDRRRKADGLFLCSAQCQPDTAAYTMSGRL